jgi:hypothetical protein
LTRRPCSDDRTEDNQRFRADVRFFDVRFFDVDFLAVVLRRVDFLAVRFSWSGG